MGKEGHQWVKARDGNWLGQCRQCFTWHRANQYHYKGTHSFLCLACQAQVWMFPHSYIRRFYGRDEALS